MRHVYLLEWSVNYEAEEMLGIYGTEEKAVKAAEKVLIEKDPKVNFLRKNTFKTNETFIHCWCDVDEDSSINIFKIEVK